MTDRTSQLQDFLRAAGCDLTTLQMVAGDASNRKYYRVSQHNTLRIVMDAPPDKGEDVRPFVHIAAWLGDAGLSAPQIFEKDVAHGFLLMEDLGDDLFARLLEKDQSDEQAMYHAAADVLLRIHDQTPPELAHYSSAEMGKMAALASVWYRANALDETSTEHDAELERLIQAKLQHLDDGPLVLIQRDYHAENLLWLPKREAVARVGLLDFQDAMLGHPAYDLVSILQDARRDVTLSVQASTLDYFTERTAFPDHFDTAYHLLGVQRNLRILGVFARLCVRDGKAWYVDYIPRVWGHITRSLSALNDPELSRVITDVLPKPDDTVLNRLRAKCR